MPTETAIAREPSVWARSPSLSLRDPWLLGPPLVALVALVTISLSGANQPLFFALNRVHLVTGDWLWQQVTIFGDAMIALALLALWLRYPRLIWAGFLAALLATLWTHGIKGPWPLPRPAAVLPPEALHVIGKTYRHGSFPSGHATTIFTLAGVLALWLPRSPWRWLPPLLAIPVALSRSIVGAHWPVDLLAGAFGGWLAAVGGLYLARRWNWGTRRPGRNLLAGLVLLACVLAPFSDLGYPEARWLQAVLGAALFAIGAHILYGVRKAPGGI